MGVLAVVALTAAADEPASTQPKRDIIMPPAVWWIAPVGSVVALLFAWVFYAQVKRANEGDERMKEIAAYVREGAYAY